MEKTMKFTQEEMATIFIDVLRAWKEQQNLNEMMRDLAIETLLGDPDNTAAFKMCCEGERATHNYWMACVWMREAAKHTMGISWIVNVLHNEEGV
jgi:hypothetical protein